MRKVDGLLWRWRPAGDFDLLHEAQKRRQDAGATKTISPNSCAFPKYASWCVFGTTSKLHEKSRSMPVV
jgi:hypothetical protein